MARFAALFCSQDPSYAERQRFRLGAGMKTPTPIAMLVLMLALLAPSPAAEAQPAGRVYRIGLLYGGTAFDPSHYPTERARVEGLRAHRSVLGPSLVPALR